MARGACASDLASGFAIGDRQVVLTAHAVGAQIYECRAASGGTQAWSFREPIAALMQDGRTIGRHYLGPNWDLADGGGVTGKVLASTPGESPGDIPLLQLQVVARRGAGVLNEAGTVLRLHTAGGSLAGACEHAGELRSVPYAADYVFLK